MSKDRIWKLAILIAIPTIIWFTTPPAGLAVNAWRLFGLYLSAILGLILKPFSEPVILLCTLAASSVLLNNTASVLSGFGDPTTWLVFSAFSLSVAFVSTGLGRRMAYFLIDKLGQTTLRLGYVEAILDFIISPVTPSNTARAGGIVLPIMNSVSLALGSEPGKTAEKAGAYLACNCYMSTLVTSLMFATAQTPNLLAAAVIKNVGGIDLDWILWAKAMLVPGLVLLAVMPYVVYKIITPTVKTLDNKTIAAKGMAEIGPMTVREKILVVIFILALLGWSMPSILQQLWGIKLALNATAVAVAAMALCFFTGVIGWDEMVKSKGGWNTLMWFGGIIGLSSALAQDKFFVWLATALQQTMSFGDNPLLALWIIGFASMAVRYLFASGSAYVIAMFPVFLTIGKVAGINPMALALLLAATNSFGGAVTHYGGAAAPLIFAAGYNEVKQWWTAGGVVAIISFLFIMTAGFAWWKMLGLF